MTDFDGTVSTSRWDRLLDHPNASTFFALIAELGFVVKDATVQHLEEVYHVPSGQIIFIVMLFTTLTCLTILLIRSPNVLPTAVDKSSGILWIRSFNLAIAAVSVVFSLQYITLSEAISILHMRPFPVLLLCYVFLGEPFSRIQLMACFISFGAVLVVFQPAFLFGPGTPTSLNPDIIDVPRGGHRLLGFLLMGTCMLCNAGDFFFLRKIGYAADTILLVMLYALASMIFGTVVTLVNGTGFLPPADIAIWLFLLAITALIFLAQMTIVLACQRASGLKVAIIGYTQVVFSVLLQLGYTGILPNFSALIGMAVIIIAGIWSTIYGTPDVETAQVKEADEDVRLGLLEDPQILVINTPRSSAHFDSSRP